MLETGQFASGIPGGYQIERRLGRSELGSAYLAYQPTRGRRAMITIFKLPRGISAHDQEQLRLRLTREEEVFTRLIHPHTMPIYCIGIQPGYLYLVTAFVKEPSLGQVLKKNVRFSPEQTLAMLKQLAAGLEYTHSQGVAHGTLSLSNVMVSDQLTMRIAGFGLHTMLEILGSTQKKQPLAHLTSEYGTFLGSPEYISPERVMGLPVDARSDIYALGVMLFELMSGSKLFQGKDPLEVATQRLQQSIPSIHAVCSEVPAAFDLFFSHVLERDPAKRTQYVGEVVSTFERILQTLNPAKWASAVGIEQQALGSDVTIAPTVNWFDEPMTELNQWEPEAPAQTDQAPNAALIRRPSTPGAQSGPLPPAGHNPNSLGGIDPFAWWTNTSPKLQAAQTSSRTPGTFAQRPPVRMNSTGSLRRVKPAQQDRRKLVKSIVIGTATVGALTVGGISFAHFTQSMNQPRVAANNTSVTGSTSGTKQASPAKKPTSKTQPTPKPQKHQTPQAHTGTVIGSTNQAVNTAVVFKNPVTGVSSLLIRLANGNFEACERTCTHEPSPENLVNYVAGNQMLKCPTHGAVFNAQNKFLHTAGPGDGALKSIAIRVNADGTITTG